MARGASVYKTSKTKSINHFPLYVFIELDKSVCLFADATFVVANEEVANNNYNISVNSYLKPFIEEDKIDIKEVNKKIVEVVKRESEIRIELDKIIQELEENFNEQD